MNSANNFSHLTQSFLTPDVIQRFSQALAQPSDKIQTGLKSVIPTFLMGMASYASTNEGAQSIFNMSHNSQLDGVEAVNGVFGNELTSVTTSLGASTGLSSSSITKMLALVAPMVLGVIRKKVKQEQMNPFALKEFLIQQKSSFAELVPVGISHLLGFGASGPSIGKVARSMKDVPHSEKPFPTTASSTLPASDKRSWAPLALLALAILAGFWWYTQGAHQMRLPAENRVLNTEKSQ